MENAINLSELLDKIKSFQVGDEPIGMGFTHSGWGTNNKAKLTEAAKLFAENPITVAEMARRWNLLHPKSGNIQGTEANIIEAYNLTVYEGMHYASGSTSFLHTKSGTKFSHDIVAKMDFNLGHCVVTVDGDIFDTGLEPTIDVRWAVQQTLNEIRDRNKRFHSSFIERVY